MVESTSLLKKRRRNLTVGSNPTRSASIIFHFLHELSHTKRVFLCPRIRDFAEIELQAGHTDGLEHFRRDSWDEKGILRLLL